MCSLQVRAGHVDAALIEVRALLAHMERQRDFTFTGSSLLFVYDGAEQVTRGRSRFQHAVRRADASGRFAAASTQPTAEQPTAPRWSQLLGLAGAAPPATPAEATWSHGLALPTVRRS